MVKKMQQTEPGYDPQYLDEVMNYGTFEEIRNNPETAYSLINDIYVRLPEEVKATKEFIRKGDFSVGKTLDGNGLRIYLFERAGNVYEIRYPEVAGKKEKQYKLLGEKERPTNIEVLFDTTKYAPLIREGEQAQHIIDFCLAQERSDNYHLLVNLYAHMKNPGKETSPDASVRPTTTVTNEKKDYLESIVGEEVIEKLSKGGEDITCTEAIAVYNAVYDARKQRIDIKTNIPERVMRQADMLHG